MPLRILHVCRGAHDPYRGDTLLALRGRPSLTQHTVALGRGGQWGVAALRGEARRFRPDVVHAWDADSAIAAALLTGRTPSVVGLASDADLRRLTRSATLRWATRRAGAVVVGAEAARRWALRAAPGLDPARLVTLPDAVRPPQPHTPGESRSEALARIAAPAQARLIAIPAALEAPSRVSELLWGADLLRVVCDEVRVLVLGAGPCRSGLIRFARLACDLEHIRFAAPGVDRFAAPGADVGWLWPHVDLVWDAARWLTPPRWLLAARSAGLPMVCADSPGVVERWGGEPGFAAAAVGVHERADRVRATVALFGSQSSPWIARDAESAALLDDAAARMADLYHRVAAVQSVESPPARPA